MQPAIHIVPRWGAAPHDDWYAWCAREIESSHGIPVHTLAMPNWDRPDVSESIAYLDAHLPPLHERTFLVGHSVGCQALLRCLSARIERGDDFRVGGFLAVAGWFTVDDRRPAFDPWLANEALPYAALEERIRYRKALLSDNDPYTSDFLENRAQWIARLAADVAIHPGRNHFNDPEEALVLHELQELLAAGGGSPASEAAPCTMRATDPPLVITVDLAAPPRRVWQALTDYWHMQQWYFDQMEDFRAAVGFSTRFAVQSGTRTFTHQWRVTAVREPETIRYEWTYAEHPGRADTEFALQPTETGTRLTLTMRFYEDFPADVPEFTRPSCRGGWDYFLGQRLRHYLAPH